MLLSKKQERHFTNLFSKREDGGVQIYVLCLFILMMFVVFWAVMLDFKRISITSDAVDDALVTSLISSCLYNKEEMRLSGATVVYHTVTGDGLKLPVTEIIPGYVDHSGNLTTTVEDRDVINGSEIVNSTGDTYLANCYSLFLKNLKKNLKLDDAMTCSMSGIDGVVTIQEFSVYNKFYNLDQDGNKTDFRFVKYTHIGGGVFNCIEYGINEYPTVYNSLDHQMYTVTESSVASTLSFAVVASRYTPVGGAAGSQTVTDVTYSRIVDVIMN